MRVPSLLRHLTVIAGFVVSTLVFVWDAEAQTKGKARARVRARTSTHSSAATRSKNKIPPAPPPPTYSRRSTQTATAMVPHTDTSGRRDLSGKAVPFYPSSREVTTAGKQQSSIHVGKRNTTLQKKPGQAD